MHKIKTESLEYISGLDGMRGLAVLFIIIFHYWPAHNAYLQGGFIGVDIFFVISGFLITSLLLIEQTQNKIVSIKNFWLRRARRLFPALFFLLLVLIATSFLLPKLYDYLCKFEMDNIARYIPDMDGEWVDLKPQLIAAACYVSNWFMVFKDFSYFEIMGRPLLLGHLWSLAIEEQFYLIWPVLFLVFRHKIYNHKVLYIIFVLTVISLLSLIILGQATPHDARAYYGTDTRSYALLLGALVAIFNQKKSLALYEWLKKYSQVLGLLGLIVLFFSASYLRGGSIYLFQYGLPLVAIASALVIISIITKPHGALCVILENKILKYIGTRSYGLYLWHWPLFIITDPAYTYEIAGFNLFLVRIIALLAIVEFSYRIIEMPIRQTTKKGDARCLVAEVQG